MVYSFTGRARFSECDRDANLTLYSMINYLQDAASFHGQAVGYGVDWTQKTQKAWVITSCQLEIIRHPRFAEMIRANTWATGFHGMLGFREFSLTSEDEKETYVIGKSDWVLYDIARQLPFRVDQPMAEAFGIHPELAIKEDLGRRKVRIPKTGGVYQHEKVIQDYQLDANGHVNNGQWVRMALKFLPEDFHVRHLRVEFKRQAYEGDVVRPQVFEQEDSVIVALYGAGGEVDFVGEFRQS